jgi:riboflavin kinase/FMN adenylyltransferase
MKLLRLSAARCAVNGERALTIGGFDGIHAGHQELIRRTCAAAQRLALPTALLSFEPLPREFMQPSDPPARLTNFRERYRLLGSLGVDEFLLLRFDAALMRLSATAFMQLLRGAGARHVVVGHDFRFGRGGEGTAAMLQAEGDGLGISIEVVAPVEQQGERVGSRSVREALAQGDLSRAERLLCRRYSMRGRVQRGAQLGRTLGFPTANIAMHRRRAPLSGIFAVRVRGRALEGQPGVASLGTRPQVGGDEPLLETHLFDFGGDLYGQEIEVEFVAKLRDEQRFESMDAMIAQMHRDAAEARRLLE